MKRRMNRTAFSKCLDDPHRAIETFSHLEILDKLLEEHREVLTGRASEVFEEWRNKFQTQGPSFRLSDAQRAWLYGVAERCGVIGAAPSENLFSQMSPERQAEERRKASRVKLPWET